MESVWATSSSPDLDSEVADDAAGTSADTGRDALPFHVASAGDSDSVASLSACPPASTVDS